MKALEKLQNRLINKEKNLNDDKLQSMGIEKSSAKDDQKIIDEPDNLDDYKGAHNMTHFGGTENDKEGPFDFLKLVDEGTFVFYLEKLEPKPLPLGNI